MSHSFIDRSSSYFTQNYENEETQKKIDPLAQLKEINNTTVREWGPFNNPPAQLFAKEEEGKPNQPVTEVDSKLSKINNLENEETTLIREQGNEIEDSRKQEIIIDGQLFNYYKTVLMESNEIVIQISLEYAGEKLTKDVENTLARMRALGYKSGTNGLLYKTKLVSRQKWINGELKWIKEGKNLGNKNFTTKGLELSTTKTTLKKELGIVLKEFGGAAVDLADILICAEGGNVMDALPTAFLIDMEVERINEIINDVSEKMLSEKILEGSKDVLSFLRESYSLYKKYELMEADSNTVDGILNQSINTYSQMLDSIYNNTEEKKYSVLFRKDSEELNIRAIIENKSI